MNLIGLGKSRESIALQWIPSHCNIPGKEKADRLAKAGSLISQADSPLPLRNIKRLIYGKLQINRASQYGDAAASKRWSTLLNKSGRNPSSLLRSVGVVCFRLLTEHDYLQRHLHRIGLKDSVCCPLCYQVEMDVVSREAKSDGNTQGRGYLGNFSCVITDFVQSTPGFQECDENVETWMASAAEDCEFQMLNDDEIGTSVQEEYYPVDDETDEV
ncbi:putative rna-directed dna polymerase from transposon bs [Trichonephila clavipes]|nr:putative rna-directed dna polymerase from transposon bs [Trichonephila clavipes]